MSRANGKAWLLLVTFAAMGLAGGEVRCETYGGGSGTGEDPYLIYTAEQMNAIGANLGDWNKHFKLMADVDLRDYTGTSFNIIGKDETDPLQGYDPFVGVFDGNGNKIINFTYDSTGGYVIGVFGIVGDWRTGREGHIRDLSLINPSVDGGTASYVGALAGDIKVGSVCGCCVEGGTVAGKGSVGGLVGSNKGGTMSTCYATCDVVAARATVGGLTGHNGGTITNCYATGSVSGEFLAAGLVSGNSGTISNCYATGNVRVSDWGTGLISQNSGTVTDSFWDIERSGWISSAGGTGKTTAQMQTHSTFTAAGWDFNTPIWEMCDGLDYPRLAREVSKPIANAGPDQVFGSKSIPPLVGLNGSRSCDPDGDQLTYRWRQIEGPAVDLSDATGGEPNFVPPGRGIYVFELVVNDGIRDSGPDTVTIEISNYPPIADAGPDQSMSSLPAVITLDGSGSYDPFGDPLAGYHWHQIGGPGIVLSDGNAVEPNFVPLEFGIYVFELVVSDGLLESSPDIVGIVIGNNRAPRADAGMPRYAAQEAVVLDGTGSFDPDGYGSLTYQWQQISGPPVVISGGNSPTPTISSFLQTDAIQQCKFELLVSDGDLTSMPDITKVIIVPAFNNSKMDLRNTYFDPNKPTVIGFGGGNCVGGVSLGLPASWRGLANLIDFDYYEPPYEHCGDRVITFISSVAPNYNKPIQTMGHSTGGLPAIDVAIQFNLTYGDARYAVNRVSFFDVGCRDYSASIREFLASRVEDEQCWLDHYFVTPPPHDAEADAGGLNVRFPEPAADHHTPYYQWYIKSLDPNTWPDGDIFNHGVTAGAYFSVMGPGKNLQLASDRTRYYFKWVDGDPDYLVFHNESLYPGRVPEPVTLVGPNDGAFVDANGAVLSCEESESAVGYQLLLGPDPYHMLLLASDTTSPPNDVITLFPFEQTWWTVKVCDQYGSTIYADPICINAENVSAQPIENLTTAKTYPCIQEAIDAAADDDEIIVGTGIWQYIEHINFKGKSLTLRSTDPQDPAVVAATVIRGDGRRPVVTFSGGEDASCVLAGFTITDGNEGIYCSGAIPTITNCSIVGNKDAGIESWYEPGWRKGPTIINCTIADNEGAGVMARGRRTPTIINCVIAGNRKAGIDGDEQTTVTNCTVANNGAWGISCYNGTIVNCIVRDNSLPQIEDYGSATSVTYSNVEGGYSGAGNIDADPCFVEPGYWDVNGVWVDGDYHLLSSSPCIDAGDNTAVPADTSDLDGDGNTTEPIPFDLDGNPRIADGNNDGNAVVDMGAYEFYLPPIEADVWIFPWVINRCGRLRKIIACVRLPEGVTQDQVDSNEPLMLYPGGIEAMRQFVMQRCGWGDGRTTIFAFFDKAELMDAVRDNGRVELQVVGKLQSGRQFCGTDTIRIIGPGLKCLGVFTSHWLEEGCGAPDWCGGFDLTQDSAVNFVDFALFDGCCIEVVSQ